MRGMAAGSAGPLFLEYPEHLRARHLQRENVVGEGVQGEDIAPGERTGRQIGAQPAGIHEPDVRSEGLALRIRDHVTQH